MMLLGFQTLRLVGAVFMLSMFITGLWLQAALISLNIVLLEAELTAIEHGLKTTAEEMINIAVIFTDCCSVKKVVTQISNVDDGRLKRRLEIFRSYNFNNLSVKVIPLEWNNLANKLVVHGRSCHGISLFPSRQGPS